ncbi:glycosyltransferase [Herbidospora cretacea]|uniref:glycosyltransferase n=1 Tax=Herbidospora cretacea TaxID=28444 RepID=UPI0007C7149C|nr:glycosyltransferase [Herbidospora cretacea]
MTARVPRNDYGVLVPPCAGSWRPAKTVSVVIPARDCQPKLDLTLAALAAQDYPAHLMEVIVVNDGGPLSVPPGVRLVPNEGWGIAWAVRTGFGHATGEVVLRLDADVVPSRGHVGAHMRWHHAADYLVVLGSLRFTASESGLPPVPELAQAVREGREGTLFEECEGHAWWHKLVDEHDGLRKAPSPVLHRLHVGASVSQHHALWTQAGGIDTSLVLAEDTDLGYRLTQAGAVFVPELDAPAWHLGRSTLMRRQPEVKRYNAPFVADRIPYRRFLRTEGGRQWLVPYIDVVIDTRGASYENVRGTADAALVSTLPDVRVTLVGDWRELHDGRRSAFDDPRLDARLIKGGYENDGRVRLVEDPGPTSAPAPFRLVCPPGWTVAAETLATLVQKADTTDLGLLHIVLTETHEGIVTARLERTTAVARAHHVIKDGEEFDDVVHELYGSEWLDGEELGFGVVDTRVKPPIVSRNTEAAHWRALAIDRKIAAGRLEKQVHALERQVAALEKKAAKSTADTARWRAKAENWRVQTVRLQRSGERTVFKRALRKARRLLG